MTQKNDVQNITIIAVMAVERQIGATRKPTVIEVARYSERAFRIYLGTGVTENALTDEHRTLINEVALALLKHFGLPS